MGKIGYLGARMDTRAPLADFQKSRQETTRALVREVGERMEESRRIEGKSWSKADRIEFEVGSEGEEKEKR